MVSERIRAGFPEGKLRQAHPYYMYDHILEVPGCLEACVSGDFVASLAENLRTIQPLNVFAVGCGTSLNACQAAAYAFRRLANIPAYAFDALEFQIEPPPGLGKDSLLVAISHSGQSLSTCEALAKAASFGAKTISITAAAGCRLVKLADIALIDPCGKEFALGKTRSYLTSALLGMMVAAIFAPGSTQEDFFRFARNLGPVLRANLAAWEERAKEISTAWAHTLNRYFLAGFGVQAANAYEFALKLIEVTGESATGFTLEELSHGPGASLRRELGVILFQTSNETLPRALQIANGVSASHAQLAVITSQPSAGWPAGTQVIAVPAPGGSTQVLDLFSSAVPAQLLLYYLAIQKGRHPDINCNDQYPELAEVSAIFFPPGTH